MALITCPECGKEISDKAQTCPNCGAPINVQKEVEVYFSRARALKCAAQKGNVYVGGQLVGTLDNGESFSIYLLPGNYQLHLESYGGMNVTRSGTLEVPSDVTRIHVATCMRWPTGALDIDEISYT